MPSRGAPSHGPGGVPWNGLHGVPRLGYDRVPGQDLDGIGDQVDTFGGTDGGTDEISRTCPQITKDGRCAVHLGCLVRGAPLETAAGQQPFDQHLHILADPLLGALRHELRQDR